MIQKSFDSIAKEDIEALIENGVLESKTLEYKQELPGGSDRERKEFLADVSSFGNASGGDILYGVKAAVDENGKKTGAPERAAPITGKTADEVKLDLEKRLEHGLAPRLPVQIKEIMGWDNDTRGFIILIRVHRSFASPHMMIYKGASRFYSRNSAGKYRLDVQELRSAFLATDSQGERIRRFQQDRLSRIVADETPVPLSSPHRLVLHMIPLGSFLNRERLDLSNRDGLSTSFKPIGSYGGNRRYNVDGLLTCSGERDGIAGQHGYCQLFSDGSIESVYSNVLLRGEAGGRRNIPSAEYEAYLMRGISSYLEGYRQLDLAPPMMISLALLGCKGAIMSVRGFVWPEEQHPIDRDTVLLPDVVIDSLDVDVPKEMKPIFDAVWNACGYPCSQNYDENGEWTR